MPTDAETGEFSYNTYVLFSHRVGIVYAGHYYNSAIRALNSFNPGVLMQLQTWSGGRMVECLNVKTGSYEYD